MKQFPYPQLLEQSIDTYGNFDETKVIRTYFFIEPAIKNLTTTVC